MSKAPAPVRRWTYPLPGEDWAALAARVFPGQPVEQSIAQLHAWNMHIVYRPIPPILFPSDIVLIEGPAAA
jgi:hypothetical protein